MSHEQPKLDLRNYGYRVWWDDRDRSKSMTPQKQDVYRKCACYRGNDEDEMFKLADELFENPSTRAKPDAQPSVKMKRYTVKDGTYCGFFHLTNLHADDVVVVWVHDRKFSFYSASFTAENKMGSVPDMSKIQDLDIPAEVDEATVKVCGVLDSINWLNFHRDPK